MVQATISILFFLLSTAAVAKNSINDSLVLSYIENREECRELDETFYFCGTSIQEARVLLWISDISKTSVGRETLFAIKKSGHRWLVEHVPHVISTAGKTLAPLSQNLENGIGADVVIQMNLDIPDSGTHLVTDRHRHLIPFTARVNFFHELSHARHKTNGTLILTYVEGQAVADENVYRQESDQLLGVTDTPLRQLFGEDSYDQQIWFLPALAQQN